jgi:hypothetical protein
MILGNLFQDIIIERKSQIIERMIWLLMSESR